MPDYDTPLGVSNGRISCLLTHLAEGTAKRLVQQYGRPDVDIDDFRQELLLHVLKHWKYYRPEKCPPDVALRVMIKQGAARIVELLKRDVLTECESIGELVDFEEKEQTWHPYQ